jgi:hypothetical protein
MKKENFSDEEVKNADYELERLNESVIKNTLITSDHIYLDLALIKDLEIGTVMAMASQRDDAFCANVYKKIQDGLPAYNKRVYSDITGYIDLPFSREEINDYMYDPKNSDRIFLCSPSTAFIKEFGKNLVVNINHSFVADKRNIPIRVHINTHPLTLSAEFGKTLTGFIAMTFDVHATYFSQDPIAISYNRYQKFDEFYFYHFSQFSLHPKIHEKLGSFQMFDKYVYALASLGPVMGKLPSNPKYKEKYVTESFLKIESGFLAIFKQFKLIKPEMCAPV